MYICTSQHTTTHAYVYTIKAIDIHGRMNLQREKKQSDYHVLEIARQERRSEAEVYLGISLSWQRVRRQSGQIRLEHQMLLNEEMEDRFSPLRGHTDLDTTKRR